MTHAYLEEGPTYGPLALSVHGFTDTPHSWRHRREALAASGFRVVTPWLRGDAPSASSRPMETIKLVVTRVLVEFPAK